MQRVEPLLLALEDIDPRLAHVERACYRTPSLQERLSPAEALKGSA
ncbi:MAG: hypothetical protein ACLFU8_02140 [Anaerolineales bacterium]